MKARFDALCERIPFLNHHLSDRIMQGLSALFPKHLPKRMTDYRDRFEHHLILKMADDGIEEARGYLKTFFPSPKGDFFECTADEGEKAFLHPVATTFAARGIFSTRSGLTDTSPVSERGPSILPSLARD
jgi:D-lactate dehydrogenase (quinone)